MFMMGEVHTQCKEIPKIKEELVKQRENLHECQSNQDAKIQAVANTHKTRNAVYSTAGGIIGGFAAVGALTLKKLMIG